MIPVTGRVQSSPGLQRRIKTSHVCKPAAFPGFSEHTANYARLMDISLSFNAASPGLKPHPLTHLIEPRTRRTLALWLATLFWAPLPLLAAPPIGSSMARAVGCLIEPDRVADVGSQVVGLVERLHVERGDTVKAGQTLVTLRNDIERANVGVADTRAKVDAEILAAKASLDLAVQKVRRAESLVAQNFVSTQAVEQAHGEAEVARQKLSQVDSQQRIWVQERRVAQAQLAVRDVRSPFAGVVAERYINLGERVEERPMMRIAVINPLRVELLIPTALYGRLAKGDQISVLPELPGAEPVQAKVQHVDRVLDAASNSFRVRLSLPNPNNRLPAGLRCKAEVPGADTLPSSAPAATSPAGPVTRPKPASAPAA